METFDGNIQLNRYDAEGLRYEMEENGNLVQFIFNQNREAVSEEDNSGLNRLIRGTELIAGRSSADSARTYYHYASDEMGSTTHIVDEAGAVQNRYEYDAWGNITAREEQIPNRFTYYGQQIDPVTQQYYLRARFYNPVVGRFTQEDTYRGDGLNLYAYCESNPIYYIDSSGYYKDAVDKAIKRTLSGKAHTLSDSEKQAFFGAISERVKNREVLTPDELRTLEILQTGSLTTTTRKQALNQIKLDLGIDRTQQPVSDAMVPLRVGGTSRELMLYPDSHQPVYTRQLVYDVSGLVDAQGNPVTRVIIQEHSYGHIYDGGTGVNPGNQFSHFNIRPVDDTATGSIMGVDVHYYFDRNTK